jgi:hypothetical protein
VGKRDYPDAVDSRQHRRHRAAACRNSNENWHGYERNDDVFSCDYKDFMDAQ